MKQYIGDFIIAGVTFFTLTLTGISIEQQQLPVNQIEKKHIDSIMQDTRVKAERIKTMLVQKDTLRGRKRLKND